MDIPLSKVYPIVAPEKYKVHFACWNGSNQPLDVFVRSRTEWESWNRWRGVHDIFNRDFIFALIDFYPERDRWLFGGSYQVLSKTGQQKAHSYVVKLLDESLPYIGRLKLIATHGLDYARQHFRFALLEQRTMKTDDLVIIQRERYWKDVLLTRERYGYNKN